MKKCPFCAEKIQDEAIVCRYCGRDLPNPEMVESVGEKHKITSVKKSSRSVWASGAIVSGILTAIEAVYVIVTAPNINDLIGNLTIGLIVTFFVWWLLITGIIAIWKKAGEKPEGRPALIFGMIVLLGVGVVVLYFSSLNGNTYAIFAPKPSPSEILLSNGFVYKGSTDGDYPSSKYEHETPLVTAIVFDNGRFQIAIDDYNYTPFIYPIITQLYGQDITDWITVHSDVAMLLSATTLEQTGTISGYDIQMDSRVTILGKIFGLDVFKISLEITIIHKR